MTWRWVNVDWTIILRAKPLLILHSFSLSGTPCSWENLHSRPRTWRRRTAVSERPGTPSRPPSLSLPNSLFPACSHRTLWTGRTWTASFSMNFSPRYVYLSRRRFQYIRPSSWIFGQCFCRDFAAGLHARNSTCQLLPFCPRLPHFQSSQELLQKGSGGSFWRQEGQSQVLWKYK